MAGVGTGIFKSVETVAKKIKEKKVYMPSGKEDGGVYMRYCKAETLLNQTE